MLRYLETHKKSMFIKTCFFALIIKSWLDKQTNFSNQNIGKKAKCLKIFHFVKFRVQNFDIKQSKCPKKGTVVKHVLFSHKKRRSVLFDFHLRRHDKEKNECGKVLSNQYES